MPDVDCTWWIESSKGKSIIVRGNHLDFGSEIKDDCSKGILQIFNGCDNKERFLVERICLDMQQIERQSILWISSGPCVTIKFSSKQGKKNKLSLAVEETEGKIIGLVLLLFPFGLCKVTIIMGLVNLKKV